MATEQLTRDSKQNLDLHPNQKKLLELLELNQHNPLTIRELQEELTVTSTSVVQHHLKQLIKKGFLRKDPLNSKHYNVLTNNPESYICYLELYESDINYSPVRRIPVPSQILGFSSSDAFLLRINNNSLSPKLYKTDFAIVQRQAEPKNGDLVVCIENEKMFVREYQVISDDITILLSFNPKTASQPSKYLSIGGVVKGKFSYQIQ